MAEYTPSVAALKAAVDLEIENCIGRVTTRSVAQKLDEIAKQLHDENYEELVEALKEAVHRLEGVWDDVGYQFDGDFTAPEDGLIARLHKVLSVATEPRP